ncbi:MAG TPA: hypothetical protein VF474_05365 [Phenylobacterium sp.]
MKKIILGVAAAVATLAAGAATAQPYGDYGRGGYDRYDGDRYDGYRYRESRHRYRDSDRDGIPDRAEWNRDRDRDGRPDQYDRYDNRRDYRWRHHHRSDRYDGRYEYRYYRY